MVLFFGLVFSIAPTGKFLPIPLAVCFRISKWSRSEAQKGGKWKHAPRSAGLGGASTHFIQTFK